MLALIGMIGLSACNKHLVGNGQSKRKARKTEAFTDIKVEGSITIYLTQGAAESLEIETDGNLHSRVKTKVEDGVLLLSVDDKKSQPSSMQAHITYRDLKSISLDNHSELHSKNLVAFERVHIYGQEHNIVNLNIESDTLDIYAAGTSVFTIKGKLDQAYYSLKGKSQLYGFELKTDSCSIQSSEFSKSELFVQKYLETQQNGMSEVVYRGLVEEENVKAMTKGRSRIRKHIKEKDEI